MNVRRSSWRFETSLKDIEDVKKESSALADISRDRTRRLESNVGKKIARKKQEG